MSDDSCRNVGCQSFEGMFLVCIVGKYVIQDTSLARRQRSLFHIPNYSVPGDVSTTPFDVGFEHQELTEIPSAAILVELVGFRPANLLSPRWLATVPEHGNCEESAASEAGM